jgi:PAS domain-containing protein
VRGATPFGRRPVAHPQFPATRSGLAGREPGSGVPEPADDISGVPAAACVRPASNAMGSTHDPELTLEGAGGARPVQAREEQFRTLTENIPGVATYLDRVIDDDPAHSIPVYISPQIEPMFGYPLSECLDETELWLRILHPDDRDRLIAADERARRDK